ncbi:uncharacterized protein LOC135083230 [Ostrinia nubilalis]|uniref:uncharacterized protein LOC135083230 n=1 Tax=Ostrinia nubilalis TaxID=29057 RepID=UPI00308232A1
MEVRTILLIAAMCGQSHQITGFGFLDKLTGAAQGIAGGILPGSQDSYSCSRDVRKDFQTAAYDFTLRMYNSVGYYNKDHFVISPLSMWLSLAAVAEGADGLYQQQLLTALNLPEERCLREKYYQIALSREQPGNDIKFMRKRLMVLDQGLRLNTTWSQYVESMHLLDTSRAPIRGNLQAVAMQLRDFLGTTSFPNLNGNSALVDALDYEGLWTTAFPEARIEREPFYNEEGQKIGMVDYMKINTHVKLAHLPVVDAKVLVLPVGHNGRYRIMIAVGMTKRGMRSMIEKLMSSVISEVLSVLQESLVPLEVAIPRFNFNFEYEASGMLDEIGVGSLFKNPEATWLISYPPAQPSSYYQRVAVKFDTPGVNALPSPRSALMALNPISLASDVATGLASAVGRDFIANRPFMYGLFDTDSNTCLFAGAYSHPD